MALMKAVTFHEFGGPQVLQVEEVERPEPGADDVLVRIRAAGICHHDVLSRGGRIPGGEGGRILGHEIAGEIVAAGANVPDKTQLLFAETDRDHLFVKEEQMMPMLPIVRVRSVQEGIQAAKTAERNYKHTAIIHSHDVEHMTAMARALDTTLFIKNGPCMAGLGLGGEGYLSYSIATPTGEGVTNPKTFCRVRRCVMVDNLRIY